MRFLFPLFCFCALLAAGSVWAAERVLSIRNDTDGDLLNILVTAKSGNEQLERYIRLDIGPASSAEIENSLGEGALRVDTGLALTEFPDINFDGAKSLTLSGPDADKLEIETQAGEIQAFTGKAQKLVPEPGENIVCELSRFRPKMLMSEVCHILPKETPVDDNGALLSGLGFAGLTWAGRLTPQSGIADPEKALLEHLELRRPFNREEAVNFLKYIFGQGYVPWQAEMPGTELDFADMPDKNPEDRRGVLLEVLNRYFEKKGGEAVIMLAPQDMLQDLANSDEPERDVQLFTLVLKPASSLMMLDVAAYEGKS